MTGCTMVDDPREMGDECVVKTLDLTHKDWDVAMALGATPTSAEQRLPLHTRRP